MNYVILSVACLLSSLVLGKTSGQLCRGTAVRADDGNWYCSEVLAITYKNISQSGAYNQTTSVNPQTGLCSHETISYPGTGPLTPLFGELSMHLRGPMNVSQLAVYQLPGNVFNPQKRNISLRRDMHDWTRNTTTSCSSTSTVTSAVVNRVESYCPSSNAFHTTTSSYRPVRPCQSTFETHVVASSSLAMSSSSHVPPMLNCVYNNTATNIKRSVQNSVAIATPSPDSDHTPSLTANDVYAAAASWSRIAYYSSTAPAQATGFAFLANLGDPQKSGTFDYSFGNSLSYVIGDGSQVASKNTPFDGMLKTSEIEIAVFTDKQCDGDCTYARPKSTAHYGWSGESKAFFIEFQMDHYDNIGSDQGMLSDAPAWWFLNAAIPRILQYGNDRNNIPCSCWSTGCGEFDAFEVLGRGEERAKSTIHRQGNLEGGDSNYFKRPVGRKLKFAVVFYQYNITARVLDDNFDFSNFLSDQQIQSLVAYDPTSWTHSLFQIGD